jgi:glycine/serine hydroxymethyltransferase
MLKEIERVNAGLELIPSENFPSKATLEVLGSIFNNKYSEAKQGDGSLFDNSLLPLAR